MRTRESCSRHDLSADLHGFPHGGTETRRLYSPWPTTAGKLRASVRENRADAVDPDSGEGE